MKARSYLYVAAMCLTIATAHAEYSYFSDVPSDADIVIKEVRWPYWNSTYYNTWWSQDWASSDGVSGYFYNGLALPSAGSANPVTTKQTVNWSFWPLSNPIKVDDTITTSYSSSNTFSMPTIGEGTIFRSPGKWAGWKTNVWYRMVIRTWRPVDGTPHRGFAGTWMKDPVSGVWYHGASIQLPFAVTGSGGSMGFQENATGGSQPQRTDYRGSYYHKNGAWNSSTNFYIYVHADQGVENVGLIEGNTAVYYETCKANGVYAGAYTNGQTSPTYKLTQPAVPTFDPIVVTNYGAEVSGNQLLVQWQLPGTSSPQFAYKVEVYTNAGYAGSIVASNYDIAPDVRQKLLYFPAGTTPYARLTIIDLFSQTNAPINITPTNATLAAATNVSGTVAGLNYAYYHSATSYTTDDNTNWATMPNFGALTPVASGAVSGVDLSPRQRRYGYAFNYTGFVTVPTNGLYAFTLNSCDGSRLYVDGQLVVDSDGKHSPTDTSNWIGLQAGQHALNVQYFCDVQPTSLFSDYFDALSLSYEGPGISKTTVPVSAYSRAPGGSEPVITLASPTNGTAISGASVPLSATVTPNGNTVNKVQFYVDDYYWAQDTSSPYSINSFLWASPSNSILARLFYNNTNVIESTVNLVTTTNMALAPWEFRQIFYHNQPNGAKIVSGAYSLIGDGVNLLTRQAAGDCTFIAHMSGITGTATAPDGSTADTDWQAGIILRGTTNMTPGYPWGQTGTAPFATLFGEVNGGTYFQDQTMVNGGGGYSSGNLGSGNKWFKLQRTGNTFISCVSSDGSTWTQVNSTNLTGFGTTLYAGFFTYAGPSANPNIHWASFDGVSLIGTNILGSPSVNVSPVTNSVIGGLSASFTASVIGPTPTGYQWQLNGTNITDATNSSYTIASATSADVGLYTVIANSVTSAPASLVITAPAGSGVWTNVSGGSWANSNNWSGGLLADGTDAAADFSTLNLAANRTVTLDGARTIGSMIFDDLNPVDHGWTLSTGSGGPLTLATSSGTPNISIKSATNTISAVLAGAQGFTKTGDGYLTLSAASTFTGTTTVSDGTLEVQNKSGDTPYTVAQGATLKIGYSTGGGYANSGLSIYGDGAVATTGFYLAGGKNYDSAGQIALLGAPTSIRQYGSGLASIGIFDINATGLWCTAAASGSALDPNVQITSMGYGMSIQVDAGVNTTTGDLTINGPLNLSGGSTIGFYKRGGGSLLLNGVAKTNLSLQLQGGTVICGTNNCIGVNASVPLSSGTKLALNGFSQAIGSLIIVSNSTLSLGGTNTLTVNSPPRLAGTVQMTISKGVSTASSRLVVLSGTLTNGGTLSVTNLGGSPLTAGDTFTLFTALGYTGVFTNYSLPLLPPGLLWDTSSVPTNGSLIVSTSGVSMWNGGGANGNWNTALNWNGTLPTSGQVLTFQGVLRQSNTNNLLTSVGQVVFGNGGFALSGNAVSLLWGLYSQTGNNSWAIPTTLSAPQSFVSSNGTLSVASTVASGGYALTLDGPGSNQVSGAISGTGALVKSGTGSAAISVQSTYTGGTIVNGGLLNLTGGGGSSGTIRGTATVNTGGTLQLGAGDVTGYGGGASALTTINLVGGNLNVSSSANQTLGSATINLTGASITGVSNGNLDFFGGGSSLNSLASSTTATISGVPLSPLRQGSTTFTVNSGTTASGIDLDISSVLRVSPSGDNAAAVLTKAGSGTMRLGATNTFAKPVNISGGTLLVSGSLNAGAPVTVSPGATLGGTGVINGAVTNNGTLAPGNFGIGRLTINNGLLLAGSALMEVSRNAGVLTNDQALLTGVLNQGGSLTVTNVGPDALQAGDSFKFFDAGTWNGSFTNLTLPALASGLSWKTNTLATNGTLTVISNSVMLVYVAGANGSLSGVATQAVNYGDSGSSVTAVPDGGFQFVDWSDGSISNPRTDANATSNLTVTANFVPMAAAAQPVILSGAQVSGGNINFQFTGTVGQHYRVDYTPLLSAPGSWQVLTDIVALSVSPLPISDLTTNTQRFYRIVAP